jgi:hypothetical protein
VKLVSLILILAMHLSEFIDDRQYDKYMKTFKHEGVPIIWENKEKHIIIVAYNKKSTHVLKNLTTNE